MRGQICRVTLRTLSLISFVALLCGSVRAGLFAALAPGGEIDDRRASIVYYAMTGEIAVDAPGDREFIGVNIDSAAHIFTRNIRCVWLPSHGSTGGSGDCDTDTNLFVASFQGGFDYFSFGEVADAGLSEEFVLSDLTVVGSVVGGVPGIAEGVADFDLVYVPVPEPSALVLLSIGVVAVLAIGRQHRPAAVCRR